jgi:hypothetical protein
VSDLPASAWKVATQAGLRRRDNDLRLLVGASRHAADGLRNGVAHSDRWLLNGQLSRLVREVCSPPFLRLRPLYRLYPLTDGNCFRGGLVSYTSPAKGSVSSPRTEAV